MELNIAFLQVSILIDLQDSNQSVHSIVIPNYLNIVSPDCYTPNYHYIPANYLNIVPPDCYTPNQHYSIPVEYDLHVPDDFHD